MINLYLETTLENRKIKHNMKHNWYDRYGSHNRYCMPTYK